MDPHPQLISEHSTLRQKAASLQALVASDKPLEEALRDFQVAIRTHFQHEDSYYRILDADKRVADRALVHQLRNDHAAVIFTIESLLIRLRKGGPNAEWKTRFENLMGVFLPHLDQEEKQLFPTGKKVLTAEELDSINKDMATHE